MVNFRIPPVLLPSFSISDSSLHPLSFPLFLFFCKYCSNIFWKKRSFDERRLFTRYFVVFRLASSRHSRCSRSKRCDNDLLFDWLNFGWLNSRRGRWWRHWFRRTGERMLREEGLSPLLERFRGMPRSPVICAFGRHRWPPSLLPLVFVLSRRTHTPLPRNPVFRRENCAVSETKVTSRSSLQPSSFLS